MDQELKQYLDESRKQSDELRNQFGELRNQFGELRKYLHARFAEIDGRFEGFDAKFATKQDLERVETALLTEFHKWASPVDTRQRSHSATLRAIDQDLEALKERVEKLERRPPS